MGNRAVITTSKSKNVKNSRDIGIYILWNGGRDSVEAFLTYCKLKGYRSPSDDNYGWAHLCQVICNYFSENSVRIDNCRNLYCDNKDNGVYIIKGWKIVGRQYFNKTEQHAYDFNRLLLDIDLAQPVNEQLGAERIKELLERST